MTPNEVAKKNGADFAKYIGECEGIKFYCAGLNDPSSAVGLPQCIIELQDGICRMATEKENNLIVRLFPDGAGEPTEEAKEEVDMVVAD